MKKHILLVEDETIVGLDTAKMLEANGFSVSIADNSREAVQIVHQKKVDLILMDIDLGKDSRDGAETAKILMSEYQIPLIFLTNYSEPKVVEKTKDIPSYGYVIKNSGDAVILATINSAFKLCEKQKKAEGKLQQLIENQNDIIYSVEHKTGEFSYISPAFHRLLGYKERDILDMGGREAFLSQIILHGKFKEQQQTLKEYKSHTAPPIQQHIAIWKCKNGEEKYIEDNWVPVYRNGKLESAHGVLRDITERMKTREKLTKALREKEYLMEEIHHRVKNNLNLISSLIHFKSAEANVDFSDLQQQIVAIGTVHDKLLQSNEIAEIDFRNYAQELLESVFFSMSSLPVEFRNNLDAINITAKIAVPLGLIINEIALNAIKHGFQAGREAEFGISSEIVEQENRYILEVWNNGKPFPPEIDINNAETLGLRLITDLLEQLEGVMEIERSPHPIFKFRFPLPVILPGTSAS